MILRLTFVASLALAGCGVAGSPSTSAPTTVAPSAVPAGILPAAAVPQLPAVTRPLSAKDVSKNSTIANLEARLQEWGYVSGWERTFQGESRQLTLVISNSLTFRDRAGARAFVQYMRDHIAGFFPFALARPLAVTGGTGWVFEPPECACHMASPYFIGVSASGSRVSWLEINGPLATARALRSLFAKIPQSGETTAEVATAGPAPTAQ